MEYNPSDYEPSALFLVNFSQTGSTWGDLLKLVFIQIAIKKKFRKVNLVPEKNLICFINSVQWSCTPACTVPELIYNTQMLKKNGNAKKFADIAVFLMYSDNNIAPTLSTVLKLVLFGVAWDAQICTKMPMQKTHKQWRVFINPVQVFTVHVQCSFQLSLRVVLLSLYFMAHKWP